LIWLEWDTGKDMKKVKRWDCLRNPESSAFFHVGNNGSPCKESPNVSFDIRRIRFKTLAQHLALPLAALSQLHDNHPSNLKTTNSLMIESRLRRERTIKYSGVKGCLPIFARLQDTLKETKLLQRLRQMLLVIEIAKNVI
jgi:hypothetical protein